MVVVPGNIDDSRLIQAIEHHKGTAPMPPDSKLRDQEIADLKRWVAEGAAWPQSGSITQQSTLAKSDHWSFQPLRREPAPPVDNEAWNRSYVDRWIYAKLQSQQIGVSERATPVELARRIAYDLTGLPPSDDLLEQITQSQDIDTLRQAVDQLLESDAFGQHWGRHWLDVARYSEMMGVVIDNDELDTNPCAYTYRNWVIEAFQRDLPYDQLIRLQIAADQWVEPNHPDLAALGFLSIGNKFEGDEPNTIDDRLDAIFRGLQGNNGFVCPVS